MPKVCIAHGAGVGLTYLGGRIDPIAFLFKSGKEKSKNGLRLKNEIQKRSRDMENLGFRAWPRFLELQNRWAMEFGLSRSKDGDKKRG